MGSTDMNSCDKFKFYQVYAVCMEFSVGMTSGGERFVDTFFLVWEQLFRLVGLINFG